MTATSPTPPGTVPPEAHGRFFLRKFLRSPKEVASVWPSSRHLARAMLAGVTVPPGHGIVELGPGTGPFTMAILQRLVGVRHAGYLGIDRDAEFAALLRARFPDREFVVDDASRMGELLAERPALRPAAIVSGLPLVAMPRPLVIELLDCALRVLPPGGHFRTFSYLHTVVNPSQWWLKRQLRERFGNCTVIGPVLRNVPPALVFAAVRR